MPFFYNHFLIVIAKFKAEDRHHCVCRVFGMLFSTLSGNPPTSPHYHEVVKTTSPVTH